MPLSRRVRRPNIAVKYFQELTLLRAPNGHFIELHLPIMIVHRRRRSEALTVGYGRSRGSVGLGRGGVGSPDGSPAQSWRQRGRPGLDPPNKKPPKSRATAGTSSLPNVAQHPAATELKIRP